MSYGFDYYRSNEQDRDRLGLVWYSRKINRILRTGATLDFGAGVGHLVRRIKGETYALEINKYAIQRISENSPKTVIIKSLDELLDSSVELVIFLHVVEHIEDVELSKILREVRRILKKDGFVFVATPALQGRAHQIKGKSWKAFSDPTHINLKTFEQWTEFFNKNGYKLQNSYGDGFYDFPYSKNLITNFKLGFRTLNQLLSRESKMLPHMGENCILLLQPVKRQLESFENETIVL